MLGRSCSGHPLHYHKFPDGEVRIAYQPSGPEGGWVEHSVEVDPSVHVPAGVTAQGFSLIEGRLEPGCAYRDCHVGTNGACVSKSSEVMRAAVSTRRERLYFPMTILQHDFGDGRGYVPARRHPNGGGVVDVLATVPLTTCVPVDACVYGPAVVPNLTSIIHGNYSPDSSWQLFDVAESGVKVYAQVHDFGLGPVRAHQHPNGGGWVADSSQVAEDAYIPETSAVYGNSVIASGVMLPPDMEVRSSVLHRSPPHRPYVSHEFYPRKGTAIFTVCEQDFGGKVELWYSHPRGGGWVACSASVPEGAYIPRNVKIGPSTRVEKGVEFGEIEGHVSLSYCTVSSVKHIKAGIYEGKHFGEDGVTPLNAEVHVQSFPREELTACANASEKKEVEEGYHDFGDGEEVRAKVNRNSDSTIESLDNLSRDTSRLHNVHLVGGGKELQQQMSQNNQPVIPIPPPPSPLANIGSKLAEAGTKAVQRQIAAEAAKGLAHVSKEVLVKAGLPMPTSPFGEKLLEVAVPVLLVAITEFLAPRLNGAQAAIAEKASSVATLAIEGVAQETIAELTSALMPVMLQLVSYSYEQVTSGGDAPAGARE